MQKSRSIASNAFTFLELNAGISKRKDSKNKRYNHRQLTSGNDEKKKRSEEFFLTEIKEEFKAYRKEKKDLRQ